MSELTVERHVELMNMVEELYEYWCNNPELRLGQIIYNFSPENHDVYYTMDSFYRAGLETANRKRSAND